jgi:hypothetical protein
MWGGDGHVMDHAPPERADIKGKIYGKVDVI